jgi:hypothetical protein
MMIAAVDERDRNRRALELIRTLQPAEAGTDNHDAMSACPLWRVCRHRSSLSVFEHTQT